jgi:RES domain-containing protein
VNDKLYRDPLRAYRIVRKGFPVFDGTGAFRRGGRWTSPGRYVIHAAETYALAVLENLVHFNAGELPPNLVYVELTLPIEVSREVLKPTALRGWKKPYPNKVSEAYGDVWYDEQRSAVLIVPSMLSPRECNLVINQQHTDSRKIEVSAAKPARLDHRIARLVTRLRLR